MNTITIQDIKSRGSNAIKTLEPLALIVNSKVEKILITPSDFEMFVEALEDLEDIQAYEENKSGPFISSEEFWAAVEKENSQNVSNKLSSKNNKSTLKATKAFKRKNKKRDR